MDRRLLFLLFTGTIATVAFFWLTEIPLGIPGEWTWNRIPLHQNSLPDLLFGIGIAAVVGAIYIAYAVLGVNRLANAKPYETGCRLLGLILVGFLWLSALQNSPPGEQPQVKQAWVLYDPGASGYFFEASHRIENLAEYLSGYEAKMSEGDVLHVGTHPPGLFVLHYGLIQICRMSPEFSGLLLQTQPQSVTESFSVVEQAFALPGKSLPETDRAALWLAGLLTQLIAVATVIPLFLLVRRTFPGHTAWKVAVLWPLVPALAIFLPKSDALYPFLGMMFLWCWLEGKSRNSILLCISAGVLFWLGMFLSLALLPVGLLAAFMTFWELKFPHQEQDMKQKTRHLLPSMTWTGLGFLIPVLVLWCVSDMNLLKIWVWNYHNHAGFYDQFPRTYWKWLLINPLELALGVGLPLVILMGTSISQMWQRGEIRTAQFGPSFCGVLVCGLLWLSGKNMGEASRLWLIFMPWALWMTAFCLNFKTDQEKNAEIASPIPRQHPGWVWLLVLQMIACIATVSHVSGFHFGHF